ncbi:MAG TPA: sulfur carrier protein ThiS [Desulfobulbus sp.]|nr:sulfur carrier protein ThiS [Desulfobulbus sp.]
MQVQINGEPEELPGEELTIAELLTHRKVESPAMVMVQLNGEFVAREQYGTTRVADSDRVEFLYFMGGGAGR